MVRDVAVDSQPPPKGFNGATGLYCGEQDMFLFMIDPTGWTEFGGQNFAPGFSSHCSSRPKRSAKCNSGNTWVAEFVRIHAFPNSDEFGYSIILSTGPLSRSRTRCVPGGGTSRRGSFSSWIKLARTATRSTATEHPFSPDYSPVGRISFNAKPKATASADRV
jgi:hypothetical protein